MNYAVRNCAKLVTEAAARICGRIQVVGRFFPVTSGARQFLPESVHQCGLFYWPAMSRVTASVADKRNRGVALRGATAGEGSGQGPTASGYMRRREGSRRIEGNLLIRGDG